MRYIVMECHLSYAVVLDEDGRFLKVANRQYQVGQTVADVIPMQEPVQEPAKSGNSIFKKVSGIAAMVACLVLGVGLLQMVQTPYASIYMTINPEVRMDVNRSNVVIGLEGLNEDGLRLIEDYTYKKKDLELVTDELVDLAIELGYLAAGGQVTLTLDGRNAEWVVTTGESLDQNLKEHLSDKVQVDVQIKQVPENESQSVISSNVNNQQYSNSDYGNVTEDKASDYRESSENGRTDYENPVGDDASDYAGTTEYGRTDYEEVTDDASDYQNPAGDDVSDYQEPTQDNDSDYSEPAEDNDSDYTVPSVDNSAGAEQPSVDNNTTATPPIVDNSTTTQQPSTENDSNGAQPSVDSGSDYEEPDSGSNYEGGSNYEAGSNYGGSDYD